MNKEGFNIRVDYFDLENEDCQRYIIDAIANDLGHKVLDKCFDIDFKNLIGNQTLGINIFLESIEIPMQHAKEIRAKYEFSEIKTKELETVYISRKEEINTSSKFYKGEKLSWKERIQAFFKGRLYGKLEVREKED